LCFRSIGTTKEKNDPTIQNDQSPKSRAADHRSQGPGILSNIWVLTNLREVVYVLAESREAEFIQDLLKDFKGVFSVGFLLRMLNMPLKGSRGYGM
jgi:hypothetical protein